MRVPIRRSERLKKRSNDPIPVTESEYARMRRELDRRKRSLPALISETAAAAAQGDRSDNAAYQTSKAALRRANWRILELEDELKRITLITPGPDAEGRIKLGSRVTVRTPRGDRTYEIVGPKETDPAGGRISQESPLGAALIGKKKGDTATFMAGAGTATCEIIEIR